MERNQKSLFGKKQRAPGEKKQMNSTVFAQTRCVLGCLGSRTGLAVPGQQHSALPGSAMGISHLMSLSAPLEGQLFTVPAPRISASRAVQPSLS